MLTLKKNVHRKNKTQSQLGVEKIAFPPKLDTQTDGHK